MNDQTITPLTQNELYSLGGGDWAWGDFTSGLAWSLGLGCFASANPFLCGGALVIAGAGYYF